jgi:hypothetical protein
MTASELPDDVVSDDDPDTELAQTMLAPPTQLAWSSEAADYPRRRSWRVAYVAVAAAVFCVALLAGAIVIAAMMLRPQPAASAPSTVLTQMQPAPVIPPPVTYTSTSTSTVPPATVTIAAPPERTWTPPATPSTDEQYLAYLRARKLTVFDRDKTITAAHWVCSQLAAGKSEAQIVAETAPLNPQMTRLGVVDAVHGAAIFYCPAYAEG